MQNLCYCIFVYVFRVELSINSKTDWFHVSALMHISKYLQSRSELRGCFIELNCILEKIQKEEKKQFVETLTGPLQPYFWEKVTIQTLFAEFGTLHLHKIRHLLLFNILRYRWLDYLWIKWTRETISGLFSDSLSCVPWAGLLYLL